ncbi:MarR family transcriptional regulator [Micromonospora mangrovi]
MFKVLAALGALGEASAAAVATHAGLGYSTATAKLRAWEQTGQVEKFSTDGNRALWRLTDSGRAHTQADPLSPEASADGPDDEPEQATPDTTDSPGPEGEQIIPADGNIGEEASGPDASALTAPVTAPPRRDDEEPRLSADADQGSAADRVADPAESHADARGEGPSATSCRRPKGSLSGAVLDILEAHPDRQYKTGELCKLIDAANAGSGTKKASAGAVYNAAVKLAAAGTAVQTVEKPATFQYAPVSR